MTNAERRALADEAQARYDAAMDLDEIVLRMIAALREPVIAVGPPQIDALERAEYLMRPEAPYTAVLRQMLAEAREASHDGSE